MAVDEAIMEAVRNGTSPATLRFFRWQPACLSIGYAQSLRKEVELAECRRRGIDVVRRPTGGRAVLHDDEVTYSLICQESDPLVSGGIVESYRKISAGILSGLQSLGAEAAATPPRALAGQSKTAACFDSPSHYEITISGRKVVGSAQMRRASILLQHGSILLGINPLELFSLLRVPSESIRNQLAADLAKQVIGLREAIGGDIHYDKVAAAIQAGFQEAFQSPFLLGSLTVAEIKEASRLRVDKYSTSAWNNLR
jgi:lipoate-protein ligase A